MFYAFHHGIRDFTFSMTCARRWLVAMAVLVCIYLLLEISERNLFRQLQFRITEQNYIIQNTTPSFCRVLVTSGYVTCGNVE